MARKPTGKFNIKWVKDNSDNIDLERIDYLVSKLPKELRDEAYNELLKGSHLNQKAMSIEVFYPLNIKGDKVQEDGKLGKDITDKDLEGTDIKKSSLKKKGPKDITPKTVDQTADAFEALDVPPPIPKEVAGGAGGSHGPPPAPDMKEYYEEALKDLDPEGVKTNQNYADLLMERGKDAAGDTTRKNYVDLLGENLKDAGADAIQQKQDYLDLMKERMEGAKLDQELKFRDEIPTREGPPPIGSKEGDWSEDILPDDKYEDLEGVLEPEMVEGPDDLGKPKKTGDYLDSFTGEYEDPLEFDPKFNKEIPPATAPPPIPPDVPTAAERMGVGGTPKATNWDDIVAKGRMGPSGGTIEGIEKALQGGQEIVTSPFKGFKMMLDDMVKAGESTTSILKEAAIDAAKYMKKHKKTAADILETTVEGGIKASPWIALGVVGYMILNGNVDEGLEMAAEIGLPLPPGVDLGEKLGEGADDPINQMLQPMTQQKGRDIRDYVPMNRGMQG